MPLCTDLVVHWPSVVNVFRSSSTFACSMENRPSRNSIIDVVFYFLYLEYSSSRWIFALSTTRWYIDLLVHWPSVVNVFKSSSIYFLICGTLAIEEFNHSCGFSVFISWWIQTQLWGCHFVMMMVKSMIIDEVILSWGDIISSLNRSPNIKHKRQEVNGYQFRNVNIHWVKVNDHWNIDLVISLKIT